jgi:hypothetical protein
MINKYGAGEEPFPIGAITLNFVGSVHLSNNSPNQPEGKTGIKEIIRELDVER